MISWERNKGDLLGSFLFLRGWKLDQATGYFLIIAIKVSVLGSQITLQRQMAVGFGLKPFPLRLHH